MLALVVVAGCAGCAKLHEVIDEQLTIDIYINFGQCVELTFLFYVEDDVK